MDAIAFLLGIVLIVGASAGVGVLALVLHHSRRVRELRIREANDQARFLLMDKALDNKMLPPGVWRDS